MAHEIRLRFYVQYNSSSQLIKLYKIYNLKKKQKKKQTTNSSSTNYFLILAYLLFFTSVSLYSVCFGIYSRKYFLQFTHFLKRAWNKVNHLALMWRKNKTSVFEKTASACSAKSSALQGALYYWIKNNVLTCRDKQSMTWHNLYL